MARVGEGQGTPNRQQSFGSARSDAYSAILQENAEMREKTDARSANRSVYQALNTAIGTAKTPKEVGAILKELKTWVSLERERIKTEKENINKILESNPNDENARMRQSSLERQEEALNAMADGSAQQIKQAQAVQEALHQIAESVRTQFKAVIDTNNENRSIINTRLQGIQTMEGMWYNKADKWSELQARLTKEYGTSMLLKETELIKNIRTAVDKGIANNVEQRALLATLSENIANTFDAFSSELNRFIRLHQQDNTTLMLGMESSLNTMLNELFKDTSYLNDNRTTQISGQLSEAMSQMNAWQASEFNFTVQKWLGSLYSLGMSEEAISNIATAIGQIYSGNVSGINENMQNLMAMSAARSGQSYAEILMGNRAGGVNDLLKSMVEYLAEIADDTNNVVRTAHGSVFGMSLSDLRSAQNFS